MSRIQTYLLLILSLWGPGFASESNPNSVTLTFYVAGVECISCVDVVCRNLSEVKGVVKVDMTQSFDPYANITFDPKLVSAQQIAQLIVEAPPLHGKPYEPTLRLHIPDYAKAGNAAKVDDVFARQKDMIEVVTIDKAKGEFVLHFLPMNEAEMKKGPRGWNPGPFERALKTGLGMKFSFEEEGRESAK